MDFPLQPQLLPLGLTDWLASEGGRAVCLAIGFFLQALASIRSLSLKQNDNVSSVLMVEAAEITTMTLTATVELNEGGRGVMHRARFMQEGHKKKKKASKHCIFTAT